MSYPKLQGSSSQPLLRTTLFGCEYVTDRSGTISVKLLVAVERGEA
jgi:hypothetical protein